MSKAGRLRELLARSEPTLLIGAHNGLTAKLAEEAGFDAVWAGGFEICAARGMPDASVLTMAEHLGVTSEINDATELPVVADCDNGFGNAINVMRLVRDYEKAGIAGISIEDNVFPKRCSFYASVRRELETVDEFVGKVRAAKQTQRDPAFVVIARTEAFIAGWGLEEALKRGRAYADAGADLILVHSKLDTPEELLAFAKQWDRPVPLAAVPTIFKHTTAQELAAHNYRLVIFANQGIRAAVKAMRETLAELRRKEFPAAVDDRIVPLEEIYKLVGVAELQSNEEQYLPTTATKTTAVILTAGMGFERELMPLIQERPKAMWEVRGKSILARQVELLRARGINDIAVVRGYKKEAVNLPQVRYFDNDRYRESQNLVSLFCAEAALEGRVLVLYGDILFDAAILDRLLRTETDIAVVVDHAWQEAAQQGKVHPVSRPELVVTQNSPLFKNRFIPSADGNRVVRLGRTLPASEAHAEFVGLSLFSARGTKILRDTYHRLGKALNQHPFHEAERFERATLCDLLQELLDQGMPITAVDIYKGWMEVDTYEDYVKVCEQIQL
ncbi:MAG: isocitrate lyase/phosphoenolpyruvate mutase family protein [Candidatus Acidiferrales bacterium]